MVFRIYRIAKRVKLYFQFFILHSINLRLYFRSFRLVGSALLLFLVHLHHRYQCGNSQSPIFANFIEFFFSFSSSALFLVICTEREKFQRISWYNYLQPYAPPSPSCVVILLLDGKWPSSSFMPFHIYFFLHTFITVYLYPRFASGTILMHSIHYKSTVYTTSVFCMNIIWICTSMLCVILSERNRHENWNDK